MKPQHARALDILKSRQGELLFVELDSGERCKVVNVAWGNDLGEDAAHITTNISPMVADEDGFEYGSDFFQASDIVRIIDSASQGVLFERKEH